MTKPSGRRSPGPAGALGTGHWGEPLTEAESSAKVTYTKIGLGSRVSGLGSRVSGVLRLSGVGSLLFPSGARCAGPGGGGRRILPGTTTAPGVRKGIGSALALLPLLVCCGLASPAPALTRRTRWAAGILVASLASLALLTPEPAKAQTTGTVSNITQTTNTNLRVTSTLCRVNASPLAGPAPAGTR